MTAGQKTKAAFEIKLLRRVALGSGNQRILWWSLFRTVRKMSTAENVECCEHWIQAKRLK